MNQCQINEKTGMTFANGLRAILRQDPDIISVGKIRDGETASIAMRCVEMVASQSRSKHTRWMLEKVAEDIGAGYSMAQSFENNMPGLPKTFIETVRAGEQSGSLEECFKRLHRYYDKSAKTKTKVINTMTYRRIFDIARLVDPGICVELTKRDEGYTLKKSEHCYAVWKKKRRCENCISQEVLRTHKPQTKLETRESDIYYVLASFIEVDGRPYSLELVKRIKSDDMFERENVLNQLLVRNWQVYMDSVTKVYNRRYYDERLKNLEGRFSFAMIDMDNFKHINDRFGHQAGDAALYRAAQTIKSQIRSDDELVRYGGDEFFLLFRDLPQQILEKKLQSIRAALDEIIIEEYPELHISVSIGGAFAAGRISRTIRRADLAMYQAKLKKDCVAIYREAKERET